VEVFINEKGNAEIAITLLRCIGWLSRDDLTTRKGHAGPMGVATPEAQLDGRYAFDYSIIPGDGQWRASVKHAYAFNTPLKSHTTSFHTGNLPITGSLVESSNPDFVITAIKVAEDGCGLVVRGYNYLPAPIDTTLRLFRTFKQAHLTSMGENPLSPIPMSNQGSVELHIEGYKIITLKFAD
jgi:alpha-mannosidase